MLKYPIPLALSVKIIRIVYVHVYEINKTSIGDPYHHRPSFDDDKLTGLTYLSTNCYGVAKLGERFRHLIHQGYK